MNEFKKFVKNENDSWEEYKDLINENTKFMMRDEDGTEIEMTPGEVINRLYQDNKTLEHYINNLQSKIDKANEILNKLCVMKPWNDSEEEMRKIYRPIKNTSKQEVYKAICDLRDILKEDK